MRSSFSSYVLGAFAMSIALGWGCGGGGLGGGCGLKPLPKDPAPRGMPPSQQIEGGGQVRITRPGFDKLSSVVGELAKQALGTPMCVPKQQQNLVLGDVSECDTACNGGTGCPVKITLRPDIVPPGGLAISMKDGANPVMHLDVAFDVHVDIPIKYKLILGGWNTACTMKVDARGTHLNVDIQLGIDPITGELTINLKTLKILGLNMSASDCGLLSWVLNAVLDFINAFATTFIGDLIVQLLTPMINNLIQGFLPKPAGLAGVMPMGEMLASFNPPADANLETYLVAGGYVSAFNGGLNLGLITGFNSDRDESTRGAGLTSEANLCVPQRPAPDLGAAPWKLPLNPPRKDFLLSVAPEFSGMPDPMDQMGVTKDLAIGISRTTLDLAGFHIYNSGTMCLAISGGVLSALNAGAVAVLVPSLGNILENRKAPLALVLRPEQPIVFTLGQGTMDDPLLHVAVTDLRIDFYTFIEERYVRLFTMALDMNVGLNLSLTMTMDGKPAIQPAITGIDKKAVSIRATNTDLLAEDPAKLGKTLLGLIDIAVGQLMGAIKPFPLPDLMGFSLDGLEIRRVQTNQDDFLAIIGNLVQSPMGMMAPVPDTMVPYERAPSAVATTAEIADVSVPPPDVIRAAVQGDVAAKGDLPSVTLKLGGNRPDLEWSYRVDKDAWRVWSADPRPTIADAAFLLQAKHVIEVRARERGDWLTEDQTPVVLPVIIDSVAPEMKPVAKSGQVRFQGWDNVSDDDAIRYAWETAASDGKVTWSAFTNRVSMSYDEAWAASGEGKRPLAIKAVDEAGNENIVHLDLAGMDEFHGRTTTPPVAGGCACDVGGSPKANRPKANNALWALLAGLFAAILARRYLRRLRAQKGGAFLALIGVAVAASFNAGCNCGGAAQRACSVDDDCRAMSCDEGYIPACIDNMCGCNPDVSIGDIGRFSTMAMRGGTSYIAAYNSTYGDLMIGHVAPPGVVKNWEFVDGIPEDAAPDNPLSQVRAGITEKGDDVGRYTSIAVDRAGDPVVAYYDGTHGALKFATFGAVRWHTHTVDKGTGMVSKGGDDIGKYASMTLAKDGSPGIAYYAEVAKGMSGMRESQLRFAQAKVPYPSGPTDWQITVVETRPMPVPAMMGGAPPPELPEGLALFCAAARKADGAPVVAYYDRERGNLRYVEYDAVAKRFGTPVILDGEDAMGGDTADVGLYPSVAMDGAVAHISYIDAKRDNLLYVNSNDKTPEVIDDGYHPKDETTLDGLDAPVWHLVGDSSSLQLLQGKVLVAYQDSTVSTLNFAMRDPMTNKWELQIIAGHGQPFKGSYGFYAQNRVSGGVAILSSYAVDQHHEIPLFYVETFAVNLGTIM